MVGHRAAVGLSLLCALVFCAFAAASASAEFGTKGVATTAVTCVLADEVGKGQFDDAHCNEESETEEGDYDHKPLEAEVNEKTDIEATSVETAMETKANASITIKFGTGETAVEITCQEAHRTGGENSYIENEEKEKQHTVTGTLEVDFVKCEVKKPAKCKVKEPIEFKAKFEGVEKMGINKNTMGVEFQGDPDPDSPFMSVVLENKGIEKCPLNGKKYDIDGTAIATGAPSPADEYSGATWKFEPGNKMQTLTVGGVNVELTATLTPRMAIGGYPIPLTTIKT